MKWIKYSFLLLIMSLAVFCLNSCTKKKEIKRPNTDDFEALSGKALDVWKYVKTKDDLEHLHLFKAIYDQKKEYLSTPSTEARIPKVVHFIWIGPRQFPRASVENVRTWMANNPDWTFYFWTDRDRPLPCPGMIRRDIREIDFLYLREFVPKSDNWAEKSDLLRCEILYKEGGVYVDHDVKCFNSFDALNRAYDFYCGIEMPYTSSLPSCVFTTNNLIGSKPGHPIILRSMQLVSEQWDQLQENYPGTDRDSMLNRVLHRTFWLFGEAVKQSNNQEGNRDIVFPGYYFNSPKDELALYARHLYAGTWHETESVFEKMVRQRLMYLSKKSNRMLLFFSVMTGLNIIGFITLFSMLRRRLRSE